MERLVPESRYSGQQIGVSETLYQHEPVWCEYLCEKAYIPEAGKTTYLKTVKPDDPKYGLKHDGDSCIRGGDQDIFADPDFDRVAVVLFVDETGSANFLPNFNSDRMNFYLLYQEITAEIDTTHLSALFY